MRQTITPGGARKLRLLCSLLLNVVLAVMELVAFLACLPTMGIGMLQYYTQDSNLLGFAAFALCAAVAARCLRRGGETPLWAHALKYIATCCLLVTFTVVVLVLAPTAGPNGYARMMLDGPMLYHHFLCPVLALVSFVLCEPEPRLTRRHTALALLPTLAYAVVSVMLNLLRVMDGPYPFLHVYEQPVLLSCVWFAVILGGAYALAWLARILNAAAARRHR